MNADNQADMQAQQPQSPMQPQVPMQQHPAAMRVKKPGVGSAIFGWLLVIFGSFILLGQLSAISRTGGLGGPAGDPVAMATFIIMTFLFSFGFIIIGIIVLTLRRKRLKVWKQQAHQQAFSQQAVQYGEHQYGLSQQSFNPYGTNGHPNNHQGQP